MFLLVFILLLTCFNAGTAQLVIGRPGVCPVIKYYQATRRVSVGSNSYLITIVRSAVSPGCCSGFSHRAVGDSCIPQCPQGCVNGICSQPYFCQCNSGFFGSDCSIDINECYRGGICPRGSTCFNTFGSYYCQCPNGFSSQGLACIEVDECAEGTHDCSHGCVNTQGSFYCTCPTGYVLGRDRKNCEDTDECLVNNGGCSQICVNTRGSLYCECYTGYTLQPDGFTCLADDLCLAGRHNCSHNCVSVPGGFYCTCPAGCDLGTDRANCQDVDECTERYTGCEQLCSNTGNCGGFQCNCWPGYRLNSDQITCGDVNECLVNNGNCDDLCTNTIGSFYCNCTQPGFILGSDGRTCDEILCPALAIPDNGIINCSGFKLAVGTTCQFGCSSGFVLDMSSTPTRTCLISGVWSGTEAVCEPLTCPDFIIPQLGMVQPCHQEYNDTCTFTCSRGYYFDSAGNSTLQLSCDLDGRMTGVQWSDSPTCSMLEACNASNPCLHGSTCFSMGLTDYDCDCTGTGYVGKNCQIGVVTIPPIPALNVSQAFVITIQARPDDDLKVSLRSDPSAQIQLTPNDAQFSSSVQTVQITMTPKKAGVFTLSFRLSGTDRNVFRIPGDLVVVVSDPTLRPPDDYFQSQGFPKGLLQPGCCDSPSGPLSICSSNVALTSTCAWDAANLTTPGIVFARNGAFSIPISVATAIVTPMSNASPLQFNIDQSPEPSCLKCPGCAVQPYDLAPGDILNFYRTETLAVTFIESIAPLIPTWLSITVIQSSRSYTGTSHVTSQFTDLDVPNCDGFPNAVYNTGHFTVLMYNGLADFMASTTTHVIDGAPKPLCIAIDVCLGAQSPVFVALPTHLTLNLMNFANRGWNMNVNGMGVNSQSSSLNSTYNILLRGSLDLINVVSIDGMGLDYSIQGQGGFTVPDIDRVFSDGLQVKTLGMMTGSVQFTIKLDNGTVLYSLHSKEESSSFSIGGPTATHPCGQPTIYGAINDNLITRGSSVITDFLEIPPNLRHGDRYQFDCGLTYTIYTDVSATVNGMVLNTSCHELRMDRLLVQDLVQTVYFGQQKQPGCLPMDVDSIIDAYPVIGIAWGTGTAKLGHLMSQDQPLIQYGLNPQTGGYSAVMHDITVMIYPTDFSTDVHIDSNPNRLYFTKVATAGGYPIRTSVTADTGNEWDSISLNVVGVAVPGSGQGLVQALQSTTLQSLQTTANTAVQRVNTAQMVVANSRNVSAQLISAKDAANTTIMKLSQQLAQIDSKFTTAMNNVPRMRQQLSTLGVNIVSLRNRLNLFCYINRCNHTCIPENVTSTCNVTQLVDIPGMCVNTTYQWVQENIRIRQVTITCESWASAIRQAQNCGCGAIFSNCFCAVNNQLGRWCIAGQYFCAIDYFQTVRYQKPVNVNVPCVIGQRTVVTPTPCQVWSDCSRTVIDVPCERANNACYANRTNFANSLDTAEAMAANFIAGIQRNQRMMISLRLCNRSKRAQQVSTQQRLDNLILDCGSFARGSRVVDISAIRRNNQAGLDLAQLLNNGGFTVTNISFSTTVTKEAIQTVNLLVTFTVGSASTEHTLSVAFDFGNPALSLTRASRQLSNAIININSPSRGKRQADLDLIESPDLEEEDLPLMNTQLMNMLSFYKMLFTGLENLHDVSQSLKAKSDDLLSFYDYDPSKPSPVQVDDSSELAELLELQNSLANDALESTTDDLAKLFPLWQASMNVYLSESGGLLGEECLGLSDCIFTTIGVFRNILSSAPESISPPLVNTLKSVAEKLQVVGIDGNNQIPNTIDSVQFMSRVLMDAISTEYWSTAPPEIYETSPYNITLLAGDEYALQCIANVSLKYPVKYQWKKDGFFLPMKNENSLDISSASRSDMGNYTCCVSNHAGTTESAWSFVTVVYKPEFYQEPDNTTVIVGDVNPVILVCNCTSVPNPQFRWYYKTKDGSTFDIVEGHTGNEFHINIPQKVDEGWYRCEAWVRYDEVTDVSTYSRPAFVSVVDYSVAVLCIPIKVELRSATRIDSEALKNDLNQLLESELLNSPEITRPTISDLTVDLMRETGNLALVSMQINARDDSLEDILDMSIPMIVNEVSACRNELFKVVNSLKPLISNTASYTENQQLQEASDVSDYRFAFDCRGGQRTGDNFILCENCAPGMYQSNATKTMEDGSGVEFTVEVQTCQPCLPGTYQPNQGSTECIPCLSGGVSHVHGDITGEHCDVDECSTSEHGCSHICTNTPGSYQCSCREGYELTEYKKRCTDIDECRTNSHSCSDECTNTEGSYSCSCREGYTLHSDQKTCEDVDECSAGEHGCSHSCTNTPGSYQCSCREGYELTENNKRCRDIDECRTNSHSCSDECTNTEGSYSCSCREGYTLQSDQKTCEDVDECSTGEHGCSHICANTPGSYQCSCREGYELTKNKKRCTDIDECATNSHSCSDACTNTEGSYSCSCREGYTLQSDQKTCEDVNDCITYEHGCSHVCTDTPGSYQCSCREGYELGENQKTCEDIDECRTNSHSCSDMCTNTEGSYSCSCREGYTLHSDQKTCEDVDECSAGEHGCSHICTNTPGSYQCSCREGYDLTRNKKRCRDIDECRTNSHSCSDVCTNTEGSYSCSCREGYTLQSDQMTCEDVDECSTSKHGCSHICTNTPGSYQCSCREGYELTRNKKRCRDIDECRTNSHSCSDMCTNTEGSYSCSCREGYTLHSDQKTCEDVNDCITYEHGCSHVCTDTPGSYQCSCREGYELGENQKTCEDFDECRTNSHACSDICTNTEGSYSCSCREGYTLQSDQKTCEDVDECSTSEHGCSHICTNTPGSYQCSCREGYELTRNKKRCRDIDECRTNSHSCSDMCTNTEGSYSCSCREGYTLQSDQKTCEDVDECSAGEHGCSHICTNTPGSYQCSCSEGYELTENKKICRDIEECRTNSHSCSDMCTNTEGSYSCSCREGYTLHSDQKTCEDVDECSTGEHGCSHICTNTPGSYQCSCGQGYELTENQRTCEELVVQPCHCRYGASCDDSGRCLCPPGLNGSRCEKAGRPVVTVLRKSETSVTFLMNKPTGVGAKFDSFQIRLYQTKPRVKEPVRMYNTQSVAYSVSLPSPAPPVKYLVSVRMKILGQRPGPATTFKCP